MLRGVRESGYNTITYHNYIQSALPEGRVVSKLARSAEEATLLYPSASEVLRQPATVLARTASHQPSSLAPINSI